MCALMTGVQTCALPFFADDRAMHDLAAPRHQRRGVRQAAGVDIFGGEEGRDAVEPRGVEYLGHEIPLVFGLKPYPCFRSCRAKSRHTERSVERRVGKECFSLCRSQWVA